MKKYGKIICGALVVPQNYPNSITVAGGTIINNPTEQDYLSNGYLPIEEVEQPAAPEGKVYMARHAVSEDGTKIVQTWGLEDVPEQIEENESNQ